MGQSQDTNKLSKPSIFQKISFALGSALLSMRRNPGRMNFDEGYVGAKHRELVKIEDPDVLELTEKQKASVKRLNTETGKLENIRSAGFQKGDIIVLDIDDNMKSKRSFNKDGNLDKVNMRIRFIEHIPPNNNGVQQDVVGAILNTHGVNSNLSISSERAKYKAVVEHNLQNPEKELMFVSYDPPGYGMSGDANINMTQNSGHKVEELMIASMNLMAIYTSAKSREINKKVSDHPLDLSIYTHSMSTGVAATLASDVFDDNQKRKSYAGVEVATKEQLNLKSISLDAPYTSFQEVSSNTASIGPVSMMPKWLYKALNLPVLEREKKVEELASKAPDNFRISIEQPADHGGELSALVRSGDGIMKKEYAYRIAAAAAVGFEKSKASKKGNVQLNVLEGITHHGKTSQRFGATKLETHGEVIQSHSKLYEFGSNIKKFFGLKVQHSHEDKDLEIPVGANSDEYYSRFMGDFNRDAKISGEQYHKYGNQYSARIAREIAARESIKDTPLQNDSVIVTSNLVENLEKVIAKGLVEDVLEVAKANLNKAEEKHKKVRSKVAKHLTEAKKKREISTLF